MLYLTIGIFVVTAVFGVLILKNWLTAAPVSRVIVYAHGGFAALGLGMLIYYFISNDGSSVKTSLILFSAAALGGFYMFYQDLKGGLGPIWLAVVHALLAVAALLILVIPFLK